MAMQNNTNLMDIKNTYLCNLKPQTIKVGAIIWPSCSLEYLVYSVHYTYLWNKNNKDIYITEAFTIISIKLENTHPKIRLPTWHLPYYEPDACCANKSINDFNSTT
jgi:hypothetical protein